MLLQMIRSVTAAGILLAAAGVSGADETQQEYFILSRPVPATATGTVDYAKVTTLSFEAKGRLSFVKTPGTLARGNILDLAGNLAVPGDLLAEQDTELPESDVKIAEARLRQAEALLREKQSNYQRDQELLRKNAVSRRQYDETLALYESAVIDRDKSKLELERARQVVEHCRIRAPYRAVVLESYQSEGASVDVGDPILKIAMIDPVRIRNPDCTAAGKCSACGRLPANHRGRFGWHRNLRPPDAGRNGRGLPLRPFQSMGCAAGERAGRKSAPDHRRSRPGSCAHSAGRAILGSGKCRSLS